MPTIGYTSEGFPQRHDPRLHGDHELDISWAQLIWSAITVGRAGLLHVLRHGAFSVFEIAYRSSILFANLREGINGRIYRSSAYIGLDPSEKSAISYFIGLTLAKAFAEARLRVPWLMHLDVYRHQLDLMLLGGGRPDLLGKSQNGRWIVMEAKGRTHGFSRSALLSAKRQALLVTSVDNVAPQYCVAVLAHFGGGDLALRVLDPDPEDTRKKIDIPVDHHALLSGYYRPISAWLSEVPGAEDVSVEDESFRVAAIPSLDLRLGLSRGLIGIDDYSDTGPALEIAIKQEDVYIGTDGVLVEVGDLWSSENMLLEPQERQ